MKSAKPSRLIIIGAGALGKQILEKIMNEYLKEVIMHGWIDDFQKDDVMGYPVIGKISDLKNLIKSDYRIIIAIGYNHLILKLNLLNLIISKGFKLYSYVHQSTIISESAIIDVGSIIYQGCIIDDNSKIESGVILNLGVIVSHNSIIKKSSYIGPGAILSGNVTINEKCFIGSGVTIKDGVSVCEEVIIGSGTNIYKDITEPGTYITRHGELIKI